MTNYLIHEAEAVYLAHQGRIATEFSGDFSNQITHTYRGGAIIFDQRVVRAALMQLLHFNYQCEDLSSKSSWHRRLFPLVLALQHINLVFSKRVILERLHSLLPVHFRNENIVETVLARKDVF